MEDWRERAACQDEDPELFFPIGDGVAAQKQISRAKAVCQHCPVRAQCLDCALSTGQDAGIWGGLTAGERRGLRRNGMRTDAGRRNGTIDRRAKRTVPG